MKVTDLKIRSIEKIIGKDGFQAFLQGKLGGTSRTVTTAQLFHAILTPEELTEFYRLAKRIIARLNTDDGEGR